jgi:hypothetical protein
MRNKMLIGGAVLAAVILAVVAVLWVTVWSVPGKQDFKAAQTSLSGIEASATPIGTDFQAYLSDVSASFNSGKLYDQTVKSTAKSKQRLDAALASHEKKVTDLGTAKAMNDGSVKKAYEAFVAQDKKYIAFTREYADTYARFRSAFLTCNAIFDVTSTKRSLSDIAKQHKQVAQPCLSDLKALSSSKLAPITDFSKKFTAVVTSRQSAFDQGASGKLSEDEVLQRIQKADADVRNIDPVSGIEKARSNASVAKEVTALKDVLKKKIDQAK